MGKRNFKGKFLALLLVIFLIIPQQAFAGRSGRSADHAKGSGFIAGAMMVGGIMVGGVPAAIGTSVSSLTGAACYASGADPETTAIVSGVTGGLAGGITGSMAGLATGEITSMGGAVANAAISTAAGTVASYTSYKISESGAHPAIASAVGSLAGLGVGLGLTGIANGAGVLEGGNKAPTVRMKDGSVVTLKEGTTFQGPKDTNVKGVWKVDKLTPGSNGQDPKITFSPAEGGTPQGITTDVPLAKFNQMFEAKPAYTVQGGPFNLKQSGSDFNPATWEVFNWSEVAGKNIGQVLKQQAPKMLVGAGVTAAVAAGLGYEHNPSNKSERVKNQIATAIGGFAGGLAGGFVQAAVNNNDENMVNMNDFIHGNSDKGQPNLAQTVVSKGIEAAARVGLAKATQGIDTPGVSGLVNLAAGAVGDVISGSSPAKTVYETLGDVLPTVSNNPVPLQGNGYDWQKGSAATTHVKNIMAVSEFAQQVAKGTLPSRVISSQFDYVTYINAADALGNAGGGAYADHKLKKGKK